MSSVKTTEPKEVSLLKPVKKYETILESAVAVPKTLLCSILVSTNGSSAKHHLETILMSSEIRIIKNDKDLYEIGPQEFDFRELYSKLMYDINNKLALILDRQNGEIQIKKMSVRVRIVMDPVKNSTLPVVFLFHDSKIILATESKLARKPAFTDSKTLLNFYDFKILAGYCFSYPVNTSTINDEIANWKLYTDKKMTAKTKTVENSKGHFEKSK